MTDVQTKWKMLRVVVSASFIFVA